MKKIILLTLLITCFEQVEAQKWSIGPKINLGTAWISSHNLNENLNAQLVTDKDIKQWNESVSPSFSFGIGGLAAYNFNEHLALVGELTWNKMSSKINMDYSKNKVNSAGDGDITSVSSEALIKVNYFSLPLLVRYSFSGEHGVYLLAGLSFGFLSTPTLESTETKTKESYKNFLLDKTTVETKAVTAPLNVFETTRTSFTLGVGYSFEAGSKSLLLDLRYDLPLTQSEMYTTGGIFEANTFENNELFGYPGKIQYEANAPGFPLNDFKMSTVELSIALILFNK